MHSYTNGIRDAWVPQFYSPAKVRLYNELDPAGTHHRPFYSLDGTIKWS